MKKTIKQLSIDTKIRELEQRIPRLQVILASRENPLQPSEEKRDLEKFLNQYYCITGKQYESPQIDTIIRNATDYNFNIKGDTN